MILYSLSGAVCSGMEGQNDEHIDDMMISEAEFNRFVERHETRLNLLSWSRNRIPR